MHASRFEIYVNCFSCHFFEFSDAEMELPIIKPCRKWGGGGTGGRETERKGGWRCTGGGRRGGGKRDSQDGGKREKKGKIMQHCTIFCNRKNAKGREPKNTGREPGLKGTGSGRFKPPCPPPPPPTRKYLLCAVKSMGPYTVSTHELTNQIQVLRETTNVKADNFASQSSFILFGQLTRKA